eukprot:124680_1
MGRLGLVIKIAAIVYLISIIKSKGSSRRSSITIGLIILYILQKIHDIGCWKFKNKNPSIPILFHKPGIGTTWFFIKHAEHELHTKLTKEIHQKLVTTKERFIIFGGVAINFSPNFNHAIYDPRLIKYIFEDTFENYIKGPFVHDTLEELLGDGIFASDGASWKFHRKVAARMFSMRNLKSYMFACAVNNTGILLDKMGELSGNTYENELDLFELFGRFTLQTFLQSAFGEKLPIIESLPKQHEFCSAFDRLVVLCEQRTIDAFWRLKRFFKISEREGKQIPKDTKILNNFAHKIIEDRNKKQNIYDETGIDKHDLLSLFIKHGGINKKDLNRKNIRDITMNFVIAARDTTRILLSWFLYEITKEENKEILDNIYFEIDKHRNDKLIYGDCAPYLGGCKKENDYVNVENAGMTPRRTALSSAQSLEQYGWPVTEEENYRKYQYLEAVICEILRLYPPVPFLQRYANKNNIHIPYKTSDGKDKILHLNKGDGVFVHTPSYLRLPSIWGTNGRNVNKINVNNFYENGVNSYDVYTFPIFNVNPRLCLGKTSALLQAKIVLISILRKYNILPVKDQVVTHVLSPILVMKNGFKVKITPRHI